MSGDCNLPPSAERCGEQEVDGEGRGSRRRDGALALEGQPPYPRAGGGWSRPPPAAPRYFTGGGV